MAAPASLSTLFAVESVAETLAPFGRMSCPAFSSCDAFARVTEVNEPTVSVPWETTFAP